MQHNSMWQKVQRHLNWLMMTWSGFQNADPGFKVDNQSSFQENVRYRVAIRTQKEVTLNSPWGMLCANWFFILTQPLKCVHVAPMFVACMLHAHCLKMSFVALLNICLVQLKSVFSGV